MLKLVISPVMTSDNFFGCIAHDAEDITVSFYYFTFRRKAGNVMPLRVTDNYCNQF